MGKPGEWAVGGAGARLRSAVSLVGMGVFRRRGVFGRRRGWVGAVVGSAPWLGRRRGWVGTFSANCRQSGSWEAVSRACLRQLAEIVGKPGEWAVGGAGARLRSAVSLVGMGVFRRRGLFGRRGGWVGAVVGSARWLGRHIFRQLSAIRELGGREAGVSPTIGGNCGEARGVGGRRACGLGVSGVGDQRAWGSAGLGGQRGWGVSGG